MSNLQKYEECRRKGYMAIRTRWPGPAVKDFLEKFPDFKGEVERVSMGQNKIWFFSDHEQGKAFIWWINGEGRIHAPISRT